MRTRMGRSNVFFGIGLLLIAAFLSIAAVVRRAESAEVVVTEVEALRAGHGLYGNYCVGCHGVERRRQGAGGGDADRQATRLHQRPVQVPLDSERHAADRRRPAAHDHARREPYLDARVVAAGGPRAHGARCSRQVVLPRLQGAGPGQADLPSVAAGDAGSPESVARGASLRDARVRALPR